MYKRQLYALRRALTQHDKLAVLTSPENTPDRIARLLLAANLQHDFQIAVAENLCCDDENLVSDLSIETIADKKFAELNVVLLWRIAPKAAPVLFGHADSAFQQRYPEKGLITKREVRAVSLARMQLRQDSIVWDIGAGSGLSLIHISAHHSTICMYLSITLLKTIRKELLIAGWSDQSPILVVQKASWPNEEKIVRGTLADIRERCLEEGITAQAMIVASPTLGARHWSELKKSKLYDASFTHRFRKASTEEKQP